jgi:hypothetical protein
MTIAKPGSGNGVFRKLYYTQHFLPTIQLLLKKEFNSKRLGSLNLIYEVPVTGPDDVVDCCMSNQAGKTTT